jgi:hypothetical protein
MFMGWTQIEVKDNVLGHSARSLLVENHSADRHLIVAQLKRDIATRGTSNF